MPVDECVNWVGATKQGGYGRVQYNGKPELAHWVSYAMFNGLELPEISEMVVRHTCDSHWPNYKDLEVHCNGY